MCERRQVVTSWGLILWFEETFSRLINDEHVLTVIVTKCEPEGFEWICQLKHPLRWVGGTIGFFIILKDSFTNQSTVLIWETTTQLYSRGNCACFFQSMSWHHCWSQSHPVQHSHFSSTSVFRRLQGQTLSSWPTFGGPADLSFLPMVHCKRWRFLMGEIRFFIAPTCL